MHVQTHILAGWCCANLLLCTPRQRLAAMVAAAAPDVDGVAILFGQDAYWTFHHTFGHNLWFALLAAAILAAWARPAVGTFLLCLAMVHLHLYMDYWGSGADWHIRYLWPLREPVWRNPSAWPFFSWQNIAAFFALLLWTVAIARRLRRTPLELIYPRLDAELVGRRRGRGTGSTFTGRSFSAFSTPASGDRSDAPQQGAAMANTSVTKVNSGSSPKGTMGQKYLASGVTTAMRMWDDEQPGEPKAAEARDYETVGYVVKGRAELEIEGQKVTLEPGDSWVVNKGQRHTYRILEPFTAVEATTPPARSHGRDA